MSRRIAEKEESMATNTPQRTAANGVAAPGFSTFSAEYATPPTLRSGAAQISAMLAMLAGVWVAISPWFLTLQTGLGHNAAVTDLVTGLAVASLGLFAISGVRGFLGLQAGSVLLGIWLIISPFVLAAKFPVTASMDWSNIWSGGIIAVLGLAALGGLRRPSRATAH